jgi:DNA repair protein RecO (recombination protein O)
VISAWLDGGEPSVGDADSRAHQRLLREFLSQHLTDGRELRAFAAWERGDVEAV